jgi:hypothetical protein
MPAARIVAERLHQHYYRRVSTTIGHEEIMTNAVRAHENKQLEGELTWKPIIAESEMYQDTIPPRLVFFFLVFSEKGCECTENLKVFRFIKGLKEEGPDVAERRWNETLDWRKQFQVDGILEEPQPHYETIKKFYSHFYHGKTKEGRVVSILRFQILSFKLTSSLRFSCLTGILRTTF